MGKTFVTLLVGAALCGWASTAHAEQPSAQQLFVEGREALKVGEIALACAKFAESDAIESTFGTTTNLATCAEGRGDLLNAWVFFMRAEKLAGPERLAFVRDRQARLRPKLAVVNVPGGTDVSFAEGPVVPLDGLPKHYLVAPGEVIVRGTVDGATAEGKCHAVAGEVAACPLAAVKTVELPKPPPPPPLPVAAPAPRSNTRASVGKVLVGAGGAALIGGVVLGLIARSGTDAAAQCTVTPTGRACPDEQTRHDATRAQQMALYSTVAFAAGGALTVGGLALWVTSPRSGATTATLTFGGSF